MRKPGEEGAPSAQDFKNAAKTAKKKKGKKREDPGGNLRSYMDTPKMKRGMKREDPKGNPAGYYDSNKKKKADMGRKGPYADGMGKKCTCDSVAEELRGLLINDGERADKPCGNSYIPQNAKCSKGAGQAKKSEAKESPRERVRQSTKSGAKRGAVLGGLYGAAVGAATGGLAGALKGAAIGGGAGAAGGAIMGRNVGATKELFKAEGKRKKINKVKAQYKKAYTQGKASGMTRKQLKQLNQKYAQKLTSALNA